MNCPATPGDDLYIYPLLSVPVARETIPSGGSMMCSSLVNRSRRNISGLRSYITIAITIRRGYKRRCRAKREILGRDVYRNRRGNYCSSYHETIRLIVFWWKYYRTAPYKHGTLRLPLPLINTIDRNGINLSGCNVFNYEEISSVREDYELLLDSHER